MARKPLTPEQKERRRIKQNEYMRRRRDRIRGGPPGKRGKPKKENIDRYISTLMKPRCPVCGEPISAMKDCICP